MKNIKKNIEKIVLNTVAKVAMNSAEHTANSACVFCIHQPELPKSVKNLRKF